ncbi:AbrB/MazE/SpoVT family DNA-binding domain-containing protein [Candidatus Woesearchaeota archaeon]|nr:AbrB/MazE/SpoVT family DNA-binding domain-containing protein [Candidatus Woesearchaeota archaeon]
MEAVGKARKWGNSLGVVLPFEFVKGEGIEEGDEIVVTAKKTGIRALRGILKGKIKMTAQEFKDEARKGWGD